MSFFRQRSPRGFHHEYIYVNARKERLSKMEEQAQNVQAAEKRLPNVFMSDNFRGMFVQATRHLRHQKERNERGRIARTEIKIAVIVVLILIWIYLL